MACCVKRGNIFKIQLVSLSENFLQYLSNVGALRLSIDFFTLWLVISLFVALTIVLGLWAVFTPIYFIIFLTYTMAVLSVFFLCIIPFLPALVLAMLASFLYIFLN